jgi:hypothetical protein
MNSKKVERSRIMVKATAPAAPPQGVKTKATDVKIPGSRLSSGVSVSQQEIQVRAYYKWEAMGKPIGKDLKFWLEAQHELMQGK